MQIDPFELPYSAEQVEDLRARLNKTRWLDENPEKPWQYGFSQPFLKEICAYWHDQFDWRSQLDKISAHAHYRAESDGIGIHFIHQRSKRPNPIPLLLIHGWPGSFLEMMKIIPKLEAFDLVVPSLPGFGYSDRPRTAGMNLYRMADLFARLMAELGYGRFAVQGGDFGAGVSTALGLRHRDRLLGIHLNYIPGSYKPYLPPEAVLTADEQRFQRDADDWYAESGSYAHLQRTHPQTAAYGLNDSPAALAAWIIEKFRDWSDCEGDVYRRFTRDELLANVTLYWTTQTIHSSLRLYYETRQAPLHFRQGEHITTPCAIAHFPKEAPFPPREWIERGYTIKRWTEMPSGGHFAAAEEPEHLANDILAFFSPKLS